MAEAHDAEAQLPAVLIVNASEDALALMGQLLEGEGFRTWGVRAWELQHGRVKPRALLQLVRPEVVVYDISVPFDVSWAYYASFRALPEMRGVPVVLTTTNRKGAEALTGPGVLELLLKPYDIAQLVERVRRALEERRRTEAEDAGAPH
ncbi:hypothetical protein FGE12_08605 [Aggregicoccus sp. 17bor-14]|uniref:response regulator n=1 Tax=Myxococcaceae TaxID=31 RepID=UPI00129C7656|nr:MULTISPECIES: hypothetical protein [Myxococcaceae]MBF5042459.1 hypothetical protein [Simulacricoccus sp. 17bor-14]MRI88230.1 hypothetical protein [Aggregicoccus sp. 17bor-14]